MFRLCRSLRMNIWGIKEGGGGLRYDNAQVVEEFETCT